MITGLFIVRPFLHKEQRIQKNYGIAFKKYASIFLPILINALSHYRSDWTVSLCLKPYLMDLQSQELISAEGTHNYTKFSLCNIVLFVTPKSTGHLLVV